MLKSVLCFIMVLGIVFPIHGQKQDYIFEQITSEAGITFNAVNSIIEDEDGFLWFGTASGLYYYNTSEITQYSYDPERDDSPPSNHINNLFKDEEGRIWISTDRGVCYFDKSTHSFSRLYFRESDRFLDNKTVSFIFPYDSSTYLIVIDELLYHFDIQELILREIKIGEQRNFVSFLDKTENGQFILGTADGKVFLNLASYDDFSLLYHASPNRITSILSLERHIWIGYNDKGLEVINPKGELLRAYRTEYLGENQISSNRIRKIVQRGNGEVWIGSSDGILVFRSEKESKINKHLKSNGLPHNSIFDLYIDSKDGVWVGTWSGGLAYFNPFNFTFPHIRLARNQETGSKNVISAFSEDPDGSIWVGIENNELKKFDPQTLAFISPPTSSTIPRVKSFSTDSNHTHWIGTAYQGLWTLENNSSKRKGDISGIFSNVLALKDGVWIGTRLSGLIYYDKKKDSFLHYRASDKSIGSISSDRIWKVFQDSQKNIWICSDFGLSVKYRDTTDFERFFYNENSNSLSRNINYTIAEDRKGKLWIGTAGAGIDIYDPEKKLFQKFALNAAIAKAEVYSILEDLDHNMWFSTNQGIYVYYPETNILRNFSERDGILGKQYHPNSGFISSSGKLYFGGGNGFNIIDPSTVKQNPLAPEVFLSKLLINNKELDEQKPEFINSFFPPAINRIELASHQNSLTLGLVANSFIKSSGNKFKYRMKKYLNDWMEISHGKDLVFTKIPAGNYVLEVLASNSDGIWATTPKEFYIEIAPPFWLSWYAYLLYFLILGASAFIILRELRFREKSRAEKILFSEKVKFFTNISHEFRTPLTLIISPLNSLMNKFKHDPTTMDHMKIIKRNADRLLTLTGQLLDFRMIELNRLNVSGEKHDVVNLCRNAFDCFEFEAREKQINCIFNSSFKSFQLQIDAEKIEKVVYNLLSNGLKYSAEKGQIILSIEQKTLEEDSYSRLYVTGHRILGEVLEIKIKDSGKGISKKNIPLIFQRFFVEHESSETGLGIGLHMCQEYIQLHGGNISVDSREGEGTTFCVNIPIDQENEFTKEETIIQYHFDKIQEKEAKLEQDPYSSFPKRLILYVEDNDELRMYFKNLLASRYKVLTAKNGNQGFDIAKEVMPDLIISDILMPGMDGMELTEKLKKSSRTEQIPIILLTALSDESYQIESMSKGANAFISKPVDESFLFAKIENILKRQDSIRRKMKGRTQEDQMISSSSQSFKGKAEKIVKENLQNPSFSVSEFALQLNMSRSSLQRKIKAELNISPSEFIRDIRLKKAIELMKSGSYNIDEIAILAGFNSTSYFIRTFKKKYGKTPLAFRSELKY